MEFSFKKNDFLHFIIIVILGVVPFHLCLVLIFIWETRYVVRHSLHLWYLGKECIIAKFYLCALLRTHHVLGVEAVLFSQSLCVYL